MVTDDERRRVSGRLRELSKYVYHPDSTYELMIDAMGVDDFVGTDDLFSCLAGLIEPDQDHYAGLDKKVDRDALLAIAGEMDDLVKAWNERYPTNRIAAYARRIREACGEAVQ